MRVQVRRHPDVAADIMAIAEYIAHDSIQAADRFVPAVEATIGALAEFTAHDISWGMLLGRA